MGEVISLPVKRIALTKHTSYDKTGFKIFQYFYFRVSRAESCKLAIGPSIIIYREFYLLSTVHNTTLSRLFIPLVKTIAGLAFMVYFYISMKLLGKIFIGLYVLALLGVPITAGVLIPGAYFMSNVYKLSAEYKRGIQCCILNRIHGFERKVHLLVLRSLPLIRCYVGDLYFMEKRAKCILIDWLVSGAVFLLLTFK